MKTTLQVNYHILSVKSPPFKILNLQKKSLQGSIPDCISNLTRLHILDLSSNHLVGKIPAKLGNLVGMIETPNIFSYSYTINGFNTEIHDLIVNWKRVEQGLSWKNLEIYALLDLSMNQISNEIPTSLGSLKALKLLNVSHNKLYGRVPASLGDLKNLEGLDLSHNNLLGSIP